MTCTEKAVKAAAEKYVQWTLDTRRAQKSGVRADEDKAHESMTGYFDANRSAQWAICGMNHTSADPWNPNKLTEQQKTFISEIVMREAVEALAAIHLDA